eukprot:358460-Chlamydomonas_euryale.AAC.2
MALTRNGLPAGGPGVGRTRLGGVGCLDVARGNVAAAEGLGARKLRVNGPARKFLEHSSGLWPENGDTLTFDSGLSASRSTWSYGLGFTILETFARARGCLKNDDC